MAVLPAVPSSAASVSSQSGHGADAAVRRPAEAKELEAKKARMHHRYDPFFQERGLTPAQADRFIELKFQQAEIREDLQASVREVGVAGGTRGVEDLRSKLYQPVTQEMRELLGEDGYAAYGEYEKTSFYRVAFIEPMVPLFLAAKAPLSPKQAEQLVGIVAANNHPIKLNATDLGTQSQIDWATVAAQAGATLTPAQIEVLKLHASQQKTGHQR